MKQASRAWYGKIAKFLLLCGYVASDSDASLSVKQNESSHIVVFLYVDDIIVSGNDEKEIAKLRSKLSIRFAMKDLGELSHFLGLEVENFMDFLYLKRAMLEILLKSLDYL